jgi:UDP-N-acetylglucosamine diphosphorylase/glucosamine-1-phosphate N-acetyltransferase
VVFEDDGLAGFGPLVNIRHVSQLRWGTTTILKSLVEKIPDATDVTLWGRPELSASVRESTGKQYNQRVYGTAFLINARARPTQDLLSYASRSEPFVMLSGNELVAARLDSIPVRPGVVTKLSVAAIARRRKTVAPPSNSLFAGYWDLVSTNGLAIADQARHFEDSLALPRSVEVKGLTSNVMAEATAEVEGLVTIDARLGPVVIEKGASIESFSRIMGPCYVGRKTKVISALIGGGTSIFESCKIGGQVENSIILPYTNKAHHGYVGDSYVGSWVNIGAGATFSNMKNTYGYVRLQFTEKKTETTLVKLGPVIGDMAKLSIGSLVYAGKSIGTGSHLAGLAAKDIPSFTYYDNGGVELLLESVLETQRRMMERRGLALSRAEEDLIRKAYQATAAERKKGRVRKGKI